MAATHLSNKQGHNVRQLRELRTLTGSRVVPRLLVGDLNLPSTVLLLASRLGWSDPGAPGSPPRPSATASSGLQFGCRPLGETAVGVEVFCR